MYPNALLARFPLRPLEPTTIIQTQTALSRYTLDDQSLYEYQHYSNR